MRMLIALPFALTLPLATGSEASTPSFEELLAAVPKCGDATSAAAQASEAPTVLLPGYGGGGFPIKTIRPEAQAFFDNGMQLAHAFSHVAASKAFEQAVRIDPACAMCHWGAAWSYGPTINFAADRDGIAKAKKSIELAEKALTSESPVREREYIAALKLRHAPTETTDNLAFARALDALSKKYPDDNALATLTADAWMVNGDPQYMARAIDLLEAALKRDRNYTPAIHFYIHITEFAGFPARAEPYADKLAALAPAASHLVHMPSHTYYWVGRYQDAADANIRAVAIDRSNAKLQGMNRPEDAFRIAYHSHNAQFGIGAALISGNAKQAMDLSNAMLAAMVKNPRPGAYIQIAMGTAYAAQGQYAPVADVMALPAPGPQHPYARILRHYARGEAMARTGNSAAVRAEIAAMKLDRAARSNRSDIAPIRVTEIARHVLIGRAAMIDGKPKAALSAFSKAAKLQETKPVSEYADPPAWWYPVRRDMAAALLTMGRPMDALREADATLAKRPKDPVTLALRARAQDALGGQVGAKADESAALRYWHRDRARLKPG